MTIRYTDGELLAAHRAGRTAAQLSESAVAIAEFLRDRLTEEVANHRVSVTDIDFANPERDIAFKTAFGTVWGRFTFKHVEATLYGLLELYKVERSPAPAVQLTRLTGMLFNQQGWASFDESLSNGWDWDIRGHERDNSETARIFAGTLSAQLLDLIRGDEGV